MNRLPLLALGALLVVLATRGLTQTSIVDTPHNLSSSGPGAIRALDEDRVCVFCHTPHGARTEAPLWNRRDSSATYQPYDSPTLVARPGQPTGSSKLCLSCHDGTVALGDLVSQSTPIDFAGGTRMPAGRSLIGTDLRDDHPISFAYSDALSGGSARLAAPHSWDPAIQLDAAGMLQCTTCHDPHDNQWGRFLVMHNAEARLCRECHIMPEFDNTPHALSNATWNGVGTTPWPHTEFDNVATNSCLNCHRSHHSPRGQHLLTGATDAATCLACHDGSVARSNVQVALRKPHRHPVLETSAAHVPGEVLTGFADHVTCSDCHSPHHMTTSKADAPMVPGTMTGVSGVTIDGTPIAEAMFGYEVCLKCHADDASATFRGIERQVRSNGVRRAFASDSPSFHPVAFTGRNPDVPSLIAPLNEQSQIACTDCHGDDATAPGSGAAAPHGSQHEFLLRREYRTGSRVSESPTAYALCYGCHDRSVVLSDRSFVGHRRHVVDERTPCSACHDAHGIDGAAGNAVNNARLINFDLSVVSPLPLTGELEYVSHGSGTGSCTLNCHGKDHNRQDY
ncbi:MAG: hypothetical protein KF858_00330 [Candidatus Sumerlaeia bacterium]|nr:hypothetical protein [Candidatus Sumerlaeia bacterium]